MKGASPKESLRINVAPITASLLARKFKIICSGAVRKEGCSGAKRLFLSANEQLHFAKACICKSACSLKSIFLSGKKSTGEVQGQIKLYLNKK